MAERHYSADSASPCYSCCLPAVGSSVIHDGPSASASGGPVADSIITPVIPSVID